MTRAILKPARPDLLVPIPGKKGAYLPAGGLELQLDPYWYRRIRFLDVVVVEEPPTPKAAKKE